MTPFQLICFRQILKRDLIDLSPDYITEKWARAQHSEESAFAMLDAGNQRAVLRYCETWHVPLPHVVQTYVKACTFLTQNLFGEATDG